MDKHSDKIKQLIEESFEILTTFLMIEHDEPHKAETLARCQKILNHAADALFLKKPTLTMLDGVTLTDNLQSIGDLLLVRNETESAVRAYRLSYTALSCIDPALVLDGETARCLYASVQSNLQAALEYGDHDLAHAIYESAMRCPLSQNTAIRDQFRELYKRIRSDDVPNPSWGYETGDAASAAKYHEARGNVPASIPLDVHVPFDEFEFCEGMRQMLGIHDRPIIGADIDDLEAIELSGFGIHLACDLAFMPRLHSVNLARNAISDAKYIDELHEVEVLNLRCNQIEDLSPFTGMHSLTTLDLSNNAIIDVSPLAELKNLQDLNLDNNHIRTISPLCRLDGLETLSIAGNSLTDSMGFLDLTSLQTLYVSRAQIQEDVLSKLREHGVDIRFREKPIADVD